MKRILGLDLGTNSIGWAIVEKDGSEGRIIKSGSRIIPMDAGELGDFAKGITKSRTYDRTMKRSARRMRERFLLRRERLHRLLHRIGFLPNHYDEQIGWDLQNDRKHYGTFLDGEEPKVAWKRNCDGKYEFIFQTSFIEMLEEFKQQYPTMTSDNKKIPYDWTLYYLRKKALTQKIEKEELAWIILNFNQKRGYNQLRDEVLEDTDNNKKPKLNKDGNIDYSVKSPNKDDWNLLKIKTEQDLKSSKKTVGQYIYDALMKNPSEKIRGGLVRTIERDFYKKELERILTKQAEFHPELNDRDLYLKCINELYRNNETHRNNISHNNFTYLILEDVLFYQRPLKSKKSLIANCPYESHKGIDKETGEICDFPIKCIAKSNPYFQEYRIWKFLSDLRIIANTKEVNGHIESDVDVTPYYIPDNNSWYNLFMWLNDMGSIGQKELLTHLGIKRKEQDNYRWNFVEDKKIPMNTTRHAMLSKMQDNETLSHESEYALWQLLYSTTSKTEIDKSLSNSNSNIYHKLLAAGISKESLEKLRSVKLPDEGYGAYSEKAIKKLLPLMRTGSMWNNGNIAPSAMQRIEQFVKGEGLSGFSDKIKDKISAMTGIYSYQRLPEWLACYIVYGRHSEAKDITKWETPNDINIHLNSFKQHSLRNPVVESVILETLRVVRDIWMRFGNIDEIHVEMGRDLKNPKDKRAKIAQRMQENEDANIRIKALLTELANSEYEVQNVRPHSPSQRDLLRIYEEDVLANHEPDNEINDIIHNLSNPTRQPSRSQILRYKCWLDQKYCSPYTGQPIPLSRLFTADYEIEHIIPQSRYFDDSFSNKVICEAEVNKLKDNSLGYEFIQKHHGQTVTLSSGKSVRIFEVQQYEQFVKETYGSRGSTSKRKNLLLNDIPVEFIKRQLNDSRYIAKEVKGLLSNVVREVDEDGNMEQEAISKNVITCNGAVTTRLKRDWGLNEVWNQLVLPRFQRLNELTGRSCFTALNSHGKEIPSMPIELQKGFSIKRIDHRHHALDAIVIACTTRGHVNLLNNESALPEHQDNKHKLSHNLRKCEQIVINGKKRTVYKEFLMPWTTFKTDTLTSLQQIVVSFKQNLRVLTQATNLYSKYEDGQKKLTAQRGYDHYAIRKSLHKETIFGHVNLQRKRTVKLKDALKDVNRIVDKRLKQKIKDLKSQYFDEKQLLAYFKNYAFEWKDYDFNKVEVFYFTDEKEKMVATRFNKNLVEIFKNKNKKQEVEKIISQITDTGIQKILTNYLNDNLEQIEFAFSPEGLELMNNNIVQYNDGKQHKPIYKVRMTEAMGQKFQVGDTGNNDKKYAEAAKGTKLFFAIYHDGNGNRSYSTIPLNIIVERLKQHLSPVPEYNDNGEQILFHLSPGDLVYVPTLDEMDSRIDCCTKPERIYKFISGTEYSAYFIPCFIGAPIIQTIELGSNNKSERTWPGETIKKICIPLSVNRLGEIRFKLK